MGDGFEYIFLYEKICYFCYFLIRKLNLKLIKLIRLLINSLYVVIRLYECY